MDDYRPTGKRTTPVFTIEGKTIFPCKVIDKDGNIKKVIPPEEFIKDSYRWHDHKWVQQPAKQDEQPEQQVVPGTPPGNSTAQTAFNFKHLSKALVLLVQNIRQLLKKAKKLAKEANNGK